MQNTGTDLSLFDVSDKKRSKAVTDVHPILTVQLSRGAWRGK